MSVDDSQIEVKKNEAEQRYEIRIGDQVAVLEYEHKGNQITYLHTGVPPALEGHNLANKLVYVALEDARATKHTVIPVCRFVASYIRRHQEYITLLPLEEQARVLKKS
jgi:predicted GNAT family acetyltransferase